MGLLRKIFTLFSVAFCLSIEAQTLPFSPDNICEKQVVVHGLKTTRAPADVSISLGAENKNNCFIVISKKDYYLYVYEKRLDDTVLVARYDACFAVNRGNKTRIGDMRTPHCTHSIPSFSISQICNAASWKHD